MITRFKRAYTAWLGAALLHVGCLVVFGLMYYHAQHLYGANEIRSAAGRVLSSLLEAETDQRGYLLTGSEKYLDGYQYSCIILKTRLHYLCHLIPITPNNLRDCHRINDLVSLKIDEMNETLSLAQAGDVTKALQIVRTDKGYGYTMEITKLLTLLKAENNAAPSNGCMEEGGQNADH